VRAKTRRSFRKETTWRVSKKAQRRGKMKKRKEKEKSSA
jgi:hypothetical protein